MHPCSANESEIEGSIIMKKYWQYIPKVLQEDFIKQRVAPLVGAGFSKNAELPSGMTMPDWNELGRKVALHMGKSEYANAVSAFTDYQRNASRSRLIDLLIRELHVFEVKPGSAHKAFCRLFHGTTIYTTNFDFLLEEALQECGYPVYIIDSEENLTIDTAEYTRLVKLHGDFSRLSKLVVTEKDYDLMYNKMKEPFSVINDAISSFRRNTLFLVGYSMEDYDIRSLFRNLNDGLNQYEIHAYCVMVDAGEEEKSKFEERNVRLINLPGKRADYPKILEEFFNEISDQLYENGVYSAKMTPEDEVKTQPGDIQKSGKMIDYVDYRKTVQSIEDLTRPKDDVGMSFSFIIKKTKELVIIDKEDFIIGAADECDYCIEGNNLVSGKHALISVDFESAKAYILDLHSTNHTYYKNSPIRERVKLKDGAEIAFANEKAVFHISGR